jgi:S-methylmethionine-dependent homocysteine/selenocysteine methylase
MNLSGLSRTLIAGAALVTAGTSFGQNITGACCFVSSADLQQVANAYNKATQQQVNYQSASP